MDVRVLTDSALISADPLVHSALTARWKDQPVSNLRLIELTVENTGSDAIAPGDFASPLTFNILDDDAGEFLDVRAVSAHPPTIAPDISVLPRTVVVAPTLLNEGDGFALKMITTSTSPLAISANARVRGVPDVSLIDSRRLDENGTSLQHSELPVSGLFAGIAFLVDVILMALMILSTLRSGPDEIDPKRERPAFPHENWIYRGRNIGWLSWPTIIAPFALSYAVVLALHGVPVDTAARLFIGVSNTIGVLTGFTLSALLSAEARKNARTGGAIAP
jgi:hypothetical protein